MKLLFLIFIFSFCCVGLVFANSVNDSFVFNTSDLPINGSAILSLNVDPYQNVSVFSLGGNGSDSISVVYPELVILDNLTTINLSFDFSIPDFVYLNNETFIRSFNVSSGNASVVYDLYFYLVYDEKIVTNIGFDMELIQGVGGVFNVSQNLLPKTYVIPVTLKGLSNGVVNISCGSWFVCPERSVFGSDNYTSFNISFVVPKLDWGSYSQNVTFVGFNNSVVTVWYVNVLKPDFIYDDYVLPDICSGDDLSYEQRMDCFYDMKIWYIEQNLEAAKFYRDLNYVCENTTITEYVVTGDVEEDFLKLYDACEADRVSARSRLDSLEGDLGICQGDLSVVNAELTFAQTVLIEQSRNDSLACISKVEGALIEAKLRDSRQKRFLFFGVVFVVFFIFSFFWWKRYRRLSLAGF